jgi:hypothetical protein
MMVMATIVIKLVNCPPRMTGKSELFALLEKRFLLKSLTAVPDLWITYEQFMGPVQNNKSSVSR